MARTGSVASHGSGDFVIAFSTTNRRPHKVDDIRRDTSLLHEDGALMSGFFQAVVESVEEAVINSLFAAETVIGRDGHVAKALPVTDVLRLLQGRC